MLPCIDGIKIIRRLREVRIVTPAPILSALGEVDDRVRGLRAGGDDYLVKPFASRERDAGGSDGLYVNLAIQVEACAAVIADPRATGEAPERIVLTNAGGHLHIAEPPAAVSAQLRA